ncbi:MAG: helix-turn-helix domain-containing protein [Alphaproteobacteria bacterium]
MEQKTEKPKSRAENPDPIDIHVGARLRVRRNIVGLTQEKLGKALGLTFQQIQKYERGTNRMGSSRLFQAAKILSVPVSYFFEEIPTSLSFTSQPGFADEAQSQLTDAPLSADFDDNLLHRDEVLKLVRAYYRIPNANQRHRVYEMIRLMSGEK